MKYLSCDLETVRISPKSPDGILMASFVVEDTENQLPLTELPHLTVLVDHGDTVVGAWGRIAVAMNVWILLAIDIASKDPKYRDKDVKRLRTMVSGDSLDRAIEASNLYPVVKGAEGLTAAVLPFLDLHFGERSRITIAGKNAASFDVPFLPELVAKRFHSRVLDPGTLFAQFDKDDALPGMDDCLARAGVDMTGMGHDALADARAVVSLLRTKYYLLRSSSGIKVGAQ